MDESGGEIGVVLEEDGEVVGEGEVELVLVVAETLCAHQGEARSTAQTIVGIVLTLGAGVLAADAGDSLRRSHGERDSLREVAY